MQPKFCSVFAHESSNEHAHQSNEHAWLLSFLESADEQILLETYQTCLFSFSLFSHLLFCCEFLSFCIGLLCFRPCLVLILYGWNLISLTRRKNRWIFRKYSSVWKTSGLALYAGHSSRCALHLYTNCGCNAMLSSDTDGHAWIRPCLSYAMATKIRDIKNRDLFTDLATCCS